MLLDVVLYQTVTFARIIQLVTSLIQSGDFFTNVIALIVSHAYFLY